MRDGVFVAVQRVLPKRTLSALCGWLTRLRGGAVTQIAIRAFIRAYGVNMAEAADPRPGAYPTFNAFFTRALAAEARPLPTDAAGVAAPADGTVSEQGAIDGDRLLQVKGSPYRLDELLDGDRALAARFHGGSFQTVYLAPYNYHRVHMPLAGRACALRYVPGALFSVNAATTRVLPRLFCRNERVVVVFDTEGGSFALVMVGALNVGSIELTVPAEGFRNRPAANFAPGETHALDGAALARGAEFGRFNMGSTVITLASPGLLTWRDDVAAGSVVRMGQEVARRADPARP